MYRLTNDLDNDLIGNDAYSGITKQAYSGQSILDSKSQSGQGQSIINTNKTKTLTKHQNSPDPRPNLSPQTGGDTPEMSTEPVGEPIPVELPGGYPGGGGGGAIPMEEEVIEEDMAARTEEDKILGMNKKLFFGGLIAVGLIGAYAYYKTKK